MTIDVAMFQPPITGSQFYVAALATPTTSGRTITGTEKLIQRFILELLTVSGSMAFSPNKGCEFLSLLTQSANNEGDVFAAFDRSLNTITNNLQSEEKSTDPNNERFSVASIIKLVLSPGQLAIKIQVIARDGTAGILNIPISFMLNLQNVSSTPD